MAPQLMEDITVYKKYSTLMVLLVVAVAAMDFVGCSSKYIGTKNEPSHQKNIVSSKLYLRKNYNGTTISCKLVEQQAVVEYYTIVSNYKRESPIGGYLIGGGICGFLYYLSIKAPEKPQVPSGDVEYQEKWKQQYDYAGQIAKYELDKKSYDEKRTLVASISGGAIAIGIPISFLWRGEYSKKEVKSKESSSENTVYATPITVSFNEDVDKTISTDNNGKIALDLGPFINSDNRSATFVFKVPKYPDFSDTLIIPASYMCQLYNEKMKREEAEQREQTQHLEMVERERILTEKLLVANLADLNDIVSHATDVSDNNDFVDKMEATFNYDVIKYYDLTETYDTPLKIKFYKKTEDYLEKLAALQDAVNGKNRVYYYVTYKYEFPQYDMKRKGFYFYLSRNHTYYGGGFPEFDKSIGNIFFKSLTTKKMTDKSGNLYNEYLHVPMTEENAYSVENNVSDTKLYFVFTVRSVVNRVRRYSFDGKWQSEKDRFVQADIVRVLVANVATHELYYDKTYGK
jgi:hypothetical protein